MSLFATTFLSESDDSHDLGRRLGEKMAAEQRGDQLSAVLIYDTINHDHAALLRGVREVCGPRVAVVGCTTQGIIARDFFGEDGYIVGAAGLGGERIRTATASSRDIHRATREKGRVLGRELVTGLGQVPRVVILHYDATCGTDMDQFQAGLHEEVQCPILGGGASHPIGPMTRTFQFLGDTVFEHGAVALAVAGDVAIETALCHGTSPVGIEMTVTRCDGNVLLELDGRSALEIWQEITASRLPDAEKSASLALGLRVGSEAQRYLVRAAFGLDEARGGVVLQAGIEPGTNVMLHHRTVPALLEGTAAMAREIAGRLGGRKPRLALGFECGARTKSYLGQEETLKENRALQEVVGRDAEWLGMLAWGELHPMSGRPAFHNYTYPLLVFTD